MAVAARQAKILEIITNQEIETQEELAKELKAAGLTITQATISRDIKELGLIKILSDSKKYKYAYMDASVQSVPYKAGSILKDAVLFIRQAGNAVVIKTVRSLAPIVAQSIEKFNLSGVLGALGSDETVFVLTDTEVSAKAVVNGIKDTIKE